MRIVVRRLASLVLVGVERKPGEIEAVSLTEGFFEALFGLKAADFPPDGDQVAVRVSAEKLGRYAPKLEEEV